MAIFTQGDRDEISAWYKFRASDTERAAIKKAFGFSDRTEKQYARTGKSGRNIIPKRLIDRSNADFTAKDRRLADTLKALSGGLSVSQGKENTYDDLYRNYKTLESAANEVSRIQGRLEQDKNGDTFIKVGGKKTYIEGVRLAPDGKGGYNVILQKPVKKLPPEGNEGEIVILSDGKVVILQRDETKEQKPINTDEFDDPTKYATGTDF